MVDEDKILSRIAEERDLPTATRISHEAVCELLNGCKECKELGSDDNNLTYTTDGWLCRDHCPPNLWVDELEKFILREKLLHAEVCKKL